LPLEDEDIEKLHALVEALEDNDEVQEVYTNAE
jgi:transcriptional/translational regulatory protein YebC/TACO1